MYNQYKMLCAKHRLTQSKYEKQQSAFNEIIKYIQTTISFENATFIEKIDAHSWDFLTTLKERVAFVDNVRLNKKLVIIVDILINSFDNNV